jgi:hypothetical protein
MAGEEGSGMKILRNEEYAQLLEFEKENYELRLKLIEVQRELNHLKAATGLRNGNQFAKGVFHAGKTEKN